MSGLFDIGDADGFFKSIKRRYDAYREGYVKRTEDLLYIILGLNHLREWIAPGYCYKKTPNTKAERFYKTIFDTKEFKILNHLANGTKHANAVKTSYSGGAPMDEWEVDIDSLESFDMGQPTAYQVDGRNIEEVIKPIIQLYDDWFSGRYHP